MLALAREHASKEGASITFSMMPAERLTYPDNYFDFIFIRDILHHVDIPLAMSELSRVSKPDALILVNEIYSHSFTDLIRQSRLVRDVLYPRMRSFIYRRKTVYITKDERKLSERDVRLIMRYARNIHHCNYFNFIITRLIPDNVSDTLNKLDRVALILVGPLGRYLAGRVVFAGYMKKDTAVLGEKN
jgi:ubiquinone/menaquinone biosynthesis C-methylase UbiE